MTPNCDKFYFVNPGDLCSAILTKFNLTLATFVSWNTGVGDNCQSMWASAYVCVHAFK